MALFLSKRNRILFPRFFTYKCSYIFFSFMELLGLGFWGWGHLWNFWGLGF